MTGDLNALLKEVSRSFYLTLRVLPAAVRPQIGLAYLLARATDTIADTGLVSLEHRRAALNALRDRIVGQRREAVDFGDLAGHQATPGEAVLLRHCEEIIQCLAAFDARDQTHIRDVIATITSGQDLDLVRFDGAGPNQLKALATDADLDDYTYRVAGCVGEFWTRVCWAHIPAIGQLDAQFLLSNGVRFGKGLQLVNILRDIPADLQKGRCYLPVQSLADRHLQPGDLLDMANIERFRPLLGDLLDRADGFLSDGWAYTKALPRTCIRVRLACAWPILIGRETTTKLRHENVLDPARKVKISRAQVRSILLRSVALYPFANAWNRLGEWDGRKRP